MKTTNYLLGYEKIKIIQDTEMFNFSLDSVLLPNFITLSAKTEKILDIGTGNAPIPLILSTKTKAKIIGVEIQKEVSDLAIQTVKLNKLENQITIINEDINKIKDKFPTETFDIITCNPPFFKVNQTSKLNKQNYKTLARHEITLNLNQLFSISKKLLKNGGIIAIVHRPERLTEILLTMKKNNIEPKKIQYIHPKPNQEANIVLIEGKKNAKPGIKVLPPIISHNKDGSYTNKIKKYFQ